MTQLASKRTTLLIKYSDKLAKIISTIIFIIQISVVILSEFAESAVFFVSAEWEPVLHGLTP